MLKTIIKLLTSLTLMSACAFGMNSSNDNLDELKSVQNSIITQIVKVADVACQAYVKGDNELGSSLIVFGNKVLGCTAVCLKCLRDVDTNTQNNVHALRHLLATLKNIAHGVIDIGTLTVKQEHPAELNAIKALIGNIIDSLHDTAQDLRSLPLTDTLEKINEMTGEFDANMVIFDEMLAATSTTTKIVVTQTTTFIAKVRQYIALTKSEVAGLALYEQMLLKTAKDFEVAINVKRESLYSYEG